MSPKSNDIYMKIAIEEAKLALEEGEVPVGAVIVCGAEVISKGRNNREKDLDITGHAEINAIKEAAKKLGTWDLSNCDLYVTLEPCLMCGGAIKQSRIRSVLYGAADIKEGAESKYHLFSLDNASTLLFRSERGEECEELLKQFFASKRP